MSYVIRGRWLGVVTAAALACAMIGTTALSGSFASAQDAAAQDAAAQEAAAQDAAPVMKAIPPAGEVKEGQDRVPVEIAIENVTNMASFQFILEYNADIFEAADPEGGPIVQRGEFLGSTGREVVCSDPVTAPGAVRYTCITLRPTPAGPNGDGTLATVYLKAIGSGTTNLTLDRVKGNLADDSATPIVISVQNAPISVQSSGGIAWWLWVVIVVGGVAVGLAAVAGVLVLRSRSRSGRPAPAA